MLGVDTDAEPPRGEGLPCARAFGRRASRATTASSSATTRAFGAYWKSFDFATSQGEQNIFTNPLRLRPDGGEMVFNLPNGMQALLHRERATASGSTPRRSRSSRTATHPDEPVVRNGISCMGCHYAGMKTFKDEVRPVIQASTAIDVRPRDRARALPAAGRRGPGCMQGDAERFAAAVVAAGGKNAIDHRTEPINALARKFSADLPAAQAAAECGPRAAGLSREAARAASRSTRSASASSSCPTARSSATCGRRTSEPSSASSRSASS